MDKSIPFSNHKRKRVQPDPFVPDEIDLKILAVLQKEGRIRNSDLAGKVGLSQAPALRRTEKLEETGYIRGYHATLNATKLGYPISAYVQVGLTAQTNYDIKLFETKVQHLPHVRECYVIAGQTDFFLRCVAKDLRTLRQFIVGTLASIPNVKSVKTTLVLKTVKDDGDEPLPATLPLPE